MAAEYQEWLARFQQECRDAEAWQAALRDKVRRDIFVRSQALGVSEEAVSAVLEVLARGAEEIGKAATPWPHEPYTKGSAGCSGSFSIADNLRRALDVLRQERMENPGRREVTE